MNPQRFAPTGNQKQRNASRSAPGDPDLQAVVDAWPHLPEATRSTRFMANRGAATDISLMSTRGGSRYDRQFTQPVIRTGVGSRGWANRANYAAIGIHQTSATEMSLFLTGGRRFTL